SGTQLPVLDVARPDPQFDRWMETNVEEQKQPGYAIVTVATPQGNLSVEQMRGLADLATKAGDGLLRFTIRQNVLLGFVRIAQLRRVYASLRLIGLADAGANEIADVTTCPGAYSC